MSRTRATAAVELLFAAQEREAALREEVRAGLTQMPKELSPKWFYDERGSALFEQITELPEYYLTRRERSILRERAREIATIADAETLIELGAGSAEKTRVLLDALTPARFVPVDVSEPTLRERARALVDEYPQLEVTGLVADFERHLPRLPTDGRRLLAFLGSTIGNLALPARARFLREVTVALDPGDSFLLGIDLVKAPQRLRAAYDDAAGVTAQFNLNVLRVLNRELGADFDLDAFAHVACWDARTEWMEMSVRSLRRQRVRLDALNLEVAFAEGEMMRTEISAKFRHEGITAELAAAGLGLRRWWSDPAGDFAVLLAAPA